MEDVIPQQLSCVMWVPSITHEQLGEENKGGSNSFRISDYLLSQDSNGSTYELWANVEFANQSDSEELNVRKPSNYNITLTIYKNTNKSCIRILSLINRIQGVRLLEFYFNHLIKKVDKVKVQDSDLESVATIEMVCTYASHNGMLCYRYSLSNLEAEFNIFANDRLPACIYHNIKALFHTHEFHDSESDAILTPYYPAIGEEDINDILSSAIEHNLSEFQNIFKNKVRTFRENYYSTVKTMRIMGITCYFLLICVVAFLLEDKLSISTHIGWFQYLSIVSCVALMLLSVDAIVHWRSKYSKFLPKEALKIKGEYVYVSTLINSKYIQDNDNCRRLSHNINNLYNVSIHYVDGIITRGNNKMALISILLAVLIFLTQLLLTIAIDHNTTNLIKSLMQCTANIII